MRLATFAVDTLIGEEIRIGIVDQEHCYIDLTVGYASLLDNDGESSPYDMAKAITPPEMVSFLEMGETAMDAARRVSQECGAGNTRDWNDRRMIYDPEEVRLLSPLPRPNSLRDAMVYEEHVKNSLGDDIPDVWYELPIYYKGNHNAIVHPDTEVVWPGYSEEMDYELELAAVIGKRGKDIPASEAEDYIAGYTIFNDFSARDAQFREMEARLGPAKGKDFANGLGPYMTTSDDIAIEDIEMGARINGELWSQGTPGSMYHSFPDVIEHVSDSEEIYPGDVIGSGTVGRGCGLELGKRLSNNDTIELVVDGIGTLTHTVVRGS